MIRIAPTGKPHGQYAKRHLTEAVEPLFDAAVGLIPRNYAPRIQEGQLGLPK
jgi:hypothetical protein